MQFDATIISPGEYRFHGKVSLEVLLEQRIQNVPSSSKSSAPLVEVARKSGALEGTSILHRQAIRCFSFLASYFQCLGKRRAVKDEIATFVSSTDLTQMTPVLERSVLWQQDFKGRATAKVRQIQSALGHFVIPRRTKYKVRCRH